MTDSRIRLRAPFVAALLTFLVPGLGQLFQGRIFKGLVYGICIIGMFVVGSQIGEWKTIQAPPYEYRLRNRTLLVLKFAAQCGVGTPALAALWQTRRFLEQERAPRPELEKPLSAPFEGAFTTYPEGKGSVETPVSGTITLETVPGGFGETVGGKFVGTTDAGKAVELTLKENVDLDPPIAADQRRHLHGTAVDAQGTSGPLSGSIPRPITNWFGAPLNDDQEQELEGRLGKWHELAVVLTWIAGLLNMLAIWDAFEGPAYGYNDDPNAQPSMGAGASPPPLPKGQPVRPAAASV